MVCTEPLYTKYADPNYPAWQPKSWSVREGPARGVKVVKSLGLVLREKITEGPLVKIDDPRFDPMWEKAGKLRMPVFIHIADAEAFFLPIDRTNERCEELHRRPEWSFDRHRGGGHPPTPATPPCVRVRTRRFETVTLTVLE